MILMLPSIIDRWRLGTIPKLWDQAGKFLTDRLGNLERILNVLHGAIEYPQPSLDPLAQCLVTTAVTTVAAVDINGATVTFTPTVDMAAEVTIVFDVQCTLFGAAGTFNGTLVVNGTPRVAMAIWRPPAVNGEDMATQIFAVTGLKSGTSYTFKLQGATTNVGTQFSVMATHTRMTIKRFPNGYRPS